MGAHRIHSLIFSLLIKFSMMNEETVPVTMWSTAEALWKTVDNAHRQHNKEVSELSWYLNPVFNRSQKKVILFWQETLNTNDIMNSDASLTHTFSNIQNVLDSAPSSIVLPTVSQRWMYQLPEYMHQKLGGYSVYVNQLPFWNPEMNGTKPLLLILKLPLTHRSAVTADNRVLADDDVIKLVINTFKANEVPYTAIFMAGRSSKVAGHSFSDVMSIGRKLLQIPKWNQYSPINVTDGEKTCILFTAKKITIKFGDQPEIDLTNKTFGNTAKVNTRNSTCSADHAMLLLNYGDVGKLKQLVIRFIMKNTYHRISHQNWFSLDFVQIFYNNALQASFNASEIYAPVTNSYHCHYISSLQKYEALLVPRTRDNATGLWHITFVQLQIQGFNINAGQFASARDCVSFFTPAVLMGLVTSLILVLVLAYTGYMLVHLKRMGEYNESKSTVYSPTLEEADFEE